MKKIAFIILFLAITSTPAHARLKDQARNLEKATQNIAKSHHRLWKVARNLWARVQHLEGELKKQAEVKKT